MEAKKKLIGLLVITLLVASISPVVNSTENYIEEVPECEGIEVIDTLGCSDNGTEVLDQKQEEVFLGYGISPPIQYAQSFKTSLSLLTKVELALWKAGNVMNNTEFTASIRETLQGEDLCSAVITADILSADEGLWIPFVFLDGIEVISSSKYYIVCKSSAGTYKNEIGWNFGLDNPYNGGSAWYYHPDNNPQWRVLDTHYPFIDFTFRTYGLDYPPDEPSINGTVEGKKGREYQYTLSATDPEGHDVSYLVDWGDDTNSTWIGPYPSGETIMVNHTWSDRGTYVVRVKAKDTFDVESDWVTLEVSMPKNRMININSLFQQFIELLQGRFPRLKLSLS